MPDGERADVLDALVENIYAYQPFGGGPHFSAGHVGLAPVVRSLLEGGRDDVLWDVMQEDTRPSYGLHAAADRRATRAGMTTMPERWTLGDSQNHMILLQIEEWFHTGVAGIQQAPDSIAYRNLIYKPTPVGDLTHAKGTTRPRRARPAASGARDATGITRYDVTVPANTTRHGLRPGQERGADVRRHRQRRRPVPALRGRLPGLRRRPGDVTFLQGTSAELPVGGTVPATLSLTLGAPATFGAFTPGVDRTYDASTTATVISTAGDATLSVDGGRLANGAFTLSEPLQVAFSKSTLDGTGVQRRRDDRASGSTSALPSRCAPAATARR